MSGKVSVKDLVPLPREVLFDDTLRQFKQVLRFDTIVSSPIRVQLLLDRRHKENRSFSKPLGYFRASETAQLTDMACAALAMANILVLQSKTDVTRQNIEDATESVLNLIKQDVVTLTEIQLGQIRMHRKALAETV